MRRATFALAFLVTLVAVMMAGVAAWDRGGNIVDRSLLVALSVIIVLSVHLLLALSRRPAVMAVWAGCLICALYGHLTFLIHSNSRASSIIAQESALSIGTTRQIQMTRESLDRIQARPVAEVASELSMVNERRVRAALNVELAQAKKAQELRDELIRLESISTQAKVTGAVDPVTQKLAQAFGIAESQITVTIGLVFALLIELIGSILWVEALRGSKSDKAVMAPITFEVSNDTPRDIPGVTFPITRPATASVTHPESSVTARRVTSEGSDSGQKAAEQLTQLILAIQSGKAKATVAGIRTYLGCSQARAMEFRRALPF